MKWSNRRTQFWVDPEFQGRFLRTLLLQELIVVTITVLLTVGVTYLVLNPANTTGEKWNTVILYFLALFCIVATIAVWLGLRLSHRICGPIYRIMQWLKSVRRGDAPDAIHLRDGDEFLELAESITETVDLIVSRQEELRQLDRALTPHDDPRGLGNGELPDLVGVVSAEGIEQEETATP